MVVNLIVVRVILNQVLSILANQNDSVDQPGRLQKRDELIRIWGKARENSRVQAVLVVRSRMSRNALKTDSAQSSSNTCKNYLLKINSGYGYFLNAI